MIGLMRRLSHVSGRDWAGIQICDEMAVGLCRDLTWRAIVDLGGGIVLVANLDCVAQWNRGRSEVAE